MCAAHVVPPVPAAPALRPIEFEILLTLCQGERHGYAIIQDTEVRTGAQVQLETGTLYRALKRLVDLGLVRPTARRPAGTQDDERRRYYAITAAGRTAAIAEAARLEQLVRSARAANLLPGLGQS
jgi:DNA-binding PadR family transcriptional regulator